MRRARLTLCGLRRRQRVPQAARCRGRNREAEEHAGDGRVDAGAEEREPGAQAEREVGEEAMHAKAVQQEGAQ